MKSQRYSSLLCGVVSVPTLVIVLLLGAACSPQDASVDLAGERLTLERLYSLPNLIGTAPGGFAWAGDESRVAFLWNDEGMPFRDVWVVEADATSTPVRWTTFPQLPSPEGDDALEVAQAQDALERDQGVRRVVWHPNDVQLVVEYRGDAWAVEPEKEARILVADASQVAFSSDGDRLAFLRAGDVWVADSNGAAPRQVTNIADENVRVASFSWSPRGSRLAVFEADRRGEPVRGIPDYLTEETTLREVRRPYPGEEPIRHRLGTLDASVSRRGVQWIRWERQPEPDMILSYRWSPGGESLAFDTSDLYAKDRRVFVAGDGGEGPVRMVAQDLDPMNETFYYWRIEWSADGQELYFLSDRETDYHVWGVEPETGTTRRLTQGAWAVAEMTSIPGGLAVTGNHGAPEERHLFSVDPSGEGEVVQRTSRAGTHSSVISPGGEWAAVAHSADDSTPEMLLVRLGSEPLERQVTRSPAAEFEDFRWVTPEYVTFTSHVDGTELHGRLTLPPDFDPTKSYPAILGSVYTDSVRNQWGGRTAHPTWGLDQFLAQEGYVLLNVDMRGSWGRGREHRRGIRLDYGGMDIEDLESGVRFLTAQGYVDPERVGLWGSSYGGLMTAMSLFKKPDVYAAGVAGAPATNVWHALTGQMAVMMRPEDQPEEYADSSPFVHAEGLQDPLMIIHGMRDQVVLYKDSVVLTQRLIQLDKDVDLVTLPNAGHGWDNEGLAQTRYAFRKLVDHFGRHLSGASE